MTHKVTVALQQKIGQPNYGSLGASCCIEVPIDEAEFAQPGLLSARIQQAYATCRQSIAEELASNHHDRASQPPETNGHHHTNTDEPASVPRPRPASDAQVRAIRAIASKAGVQLASELQDRFGVRSPNQLSLGQASQMIDQLKSQLEPA